MPRTSRRAEVEIGSEAGRLGWWRQTSDRWWPHSRARCPGHTERDGPLDGGRVPSSPPHPNPLPRGGGEGTGCSPIRVYPCHPWLRPLPSANKKEDASCDASSSVPAIAVRAISARVGCWYLRFPGLPLSARTCLRRQTCGDFEFRRWDRREVGHTPFRRHRWSDVGDRDGVLTRRGTIGQVVRP